MAKIILEFDGVEEKIEAQTAIDGVKWKSVVWDLNQFIRNQLKHNDSIGIEAIRKLEDVQAEIFDLMEQDNLSLDN